jgi:hypothetical protein
MCLCINIYIKNKAQKLPPIQIIGVDIVVEEGDSDSCRSSFFFVQPIDISPAYISEKRGRYLLF